MKKYILKRVLIAVVTTLVILLVLYLMLDLMPGSPFNDEKMSDVQRAALYEKYGLDDPFVIRYFRFVWNMIHGDFGVSYAIQKNMPISRMLAARIPLTVQIALQAALLGTTVGLILGIVAAIKKNSIWDTTATTVSVLGVSLPSFVFALVLSYLFSYKYKIFPLLYTDKEAFKSTILPTISLSMFTIASIARYTRSELIDVMNSEYILLADHPGTVDHYPWYPQRPDWSDYGAGAFGRQFDDRKPGGGEGLLHSRHWHALYQGHPDERLQCNLGYQLPV